MQLTPKILKSFKRSPEASKAASPKLETAIKPGVSKSTIKSEKVMKTVAHSIETTAISPKPSVKSKGAVKSTDSSKHLSRNTTKSEILIKSITKSPEKAKRLTYSPEKAKSVAKSPETVRVVAGASAKTPVVAKTPKSKPVVKQSSRKSERRIKSKSLSK